MEEPTPILSLEEPEAGIAIVWMDDPAEPVNTLKRELIDEFESVLSEIERNTGLEVLVFASGKPDNFVAGANLDMLNDVASAADAQALSEISQGMQGRIEALNCTTVAAIHGACLGGGLELALAFDARVVTNDSSTRLGLPEVQLGLLPGGGGTQRLPRLIGVERALDLLLTGRQVSAAHARRLGLVDEVVAKEILIEAAIKRGRDLRAQVPAAGWRKVLTDASKYASVNALRELTLGGNALGRRLLFEQAKKRADGRTRGNYPAPVKILHAVRTGLEKGRAAGLAAEARAFGELVISPESRQLINLFFATTQLKKDRGIKDASVDERDIDKVCVLGAGLMGAGIAYVTVAKVGVPVRLKDKDAQGLAGGLAQVRKLLDGRVKKRAMTPLQRAQTLAILTGTTDYSGVNNADLIIEAVFENLELKHQMVREIEALNGAETIFATNTSALPISEIATASAHPETVIGMHYFSPVERMPLLEIVVTENTAPWVTATCVEFGKRQGKTVIVVNDAPGFYTTRILGAYMNEAAKLLTEGVSVQRIDNALMDWGFPVGPMTLLDEVGIDVGHKVGETLYEAFGERMAPVAGIDRLLDDGRLGRKNKRGLYRYDRMEKKGPRQVDETVYSVLDIDAGNIMSSRDIAERCALRMINEAVYCLAEEVLRNVRDGDIGAVLGLGFPPFRGGPFRYIDEVGARYVVDRLGVLGKLNGASFAPAPILLEAAESGDEFYGH
ncbi:MAG: fatty acid oxidation complex subunit alpha FadJ [Gammaproteobacteria bacterium]|nr:fatty acid oxidation complex subunit alpha FadJ [Gammaproteobacteria bacterium]